VPYVSEAQAMTRGLAFGEGVQVDQLRMQELYGTVSTLFGVVSAISMAVSRTKWELYRKAPNGNPEDRTVVRNHPALVVWSKPNPFYTRQEFVESFEQHVDLTGEGWWVMYRDPRAPALGPMEIWPVRPDRMQVVKSPTEFLLGYIYRGPDGQDVPLDRDEVIQIRMPNPIDPYRGMGAVQSLLSTVQGQAAALAYNRNFFRNDASPGGIITFPEELDDDEWKRFKRRWDATHQGVSNAHKVATLEGGAKWEAGTYSYDEMQFTELIGVSRDLVREAFLVHKHILGQSDDVNRANAIAADDAFAARVVEPRLERIKGALNNDFLPLFPRSQDLEFDYLNPRPKNAEEDNADRASRTTAYKTLVDAGVDPNDAAEVAGLPPMNAIREPIPSTRGGE
jgi:HK97 family phage portal protein